jgi:predicted TIM-barrel fold metal-dependent hydrolase
MVPPTKSIVIDCHTHLLKKAFPFAGLTAHFGWHEFGGDLLIAEMDRAGVDKAIVKCYSPTDLQYVNAKAWPGGISTFDTGESFVLPFIRKYPGRLLWMDVFNPKDDDMQEWPEKIKDPDLIGLALFPTNFYPSGHTLIHDNYIRVFELSIEQGKKPATITFEHTPNDQQENRLADWVKLVRRFGKKLNWCVLHGGYWNRGSGRRWGQLHRRSLVPAIQELNAEFDNVWIETADHQDDEYPFLDWQERTNQLVEEFGYDKICWGTDWPYAEWTTKYFELVEAVRRHGWWASQKQKQWYLGENAARFLNLPEAGVLK